MTVEDLFAAEAKLRCAARDYSSVGHAPSTQTLECKRRHARELREAARSYARIADAFEEAMASRIAQESGCGHLADSDTPAANLMPDPCPNCGRYYVNDDNSVEPAVRP